MIVQRTRHGYETYTDKNPHGLSDNLLANKLGIGLDNTRHTIDYKSLHRTTYQPLSLCNDGIR